jgi:hypothetical protein
VRTVPAGVQSPPLPPIQRGLGENLGRGYSNTTGQWIQVTSRSVEFEREERHVVNLDHPRTKKLYRAPPRRASAFPHHRHHRRRAAASHDLMIITGGIRASGHHERNHIIPVLHCIALYLCGAISRSKRRRQLWFMTLQYRSVLVPRPRRTRIALSSPSLPT